jgi:hypothetical protein
MASIAELKKDFQFLIKNNNIAHGYIFFGHESAGERSAFVKELANFFETKKWEFGVRQLSDFLILDANDGEGGIEAVRLAGKFLWQKPVASAKRTLVIDRADSLTVPAQNAILKIAEEPPAHALIILLVKTPEGLLPAVRSRVQQIFIAGESETANRESQTAKSFLKSSVAKRKDLLKALMEEVKETENGHLLEDFVTGLILELRRDKLKNWKGLKELLARWSLIKQFNVNKKLQLEAVLNLL